MKKTKTSPLNKPTVSSVTTKLKQFHNGVQASSPEDTIARKQKLLNLLDLAVEQAEDKIQSGKLEITSTADIERLIKMTLLVSGEANDIHGSTDSVEKTETSEALSMSQIDKILDINDPGVREMYEKLYAGYNNVNDIEDD